MDDIEITFGVVIVVVVAAVVTAVLLLHYEVIVFKRAIQNDAVDVGAAEYYRNEVDGPLMFRWTPNGEQDDE